MNIGDKVVCIDDSPSKCPCCKGEKLNISKNLVYVISGLALKDGIFLIGVNQFHNDKRNSIDYGFLSTRFVSLTDLKNKSSKPLDTYA